MLWAKFPSKWVSETLSGNRTADALLYDGLPFLMAILLFAMRCKHQGLVLWAASSPVLVIFSEATYAAYCIQNPIFYYYRLRGASWWQT